MHDTSVPPPPDLTVELSDLAFLEAHGTGTVQRVGPMVHEARGVTLDDREHHQRRCGDPDPEPDLGSASGGFTRAACLNDVAVHALGPRGSASTN